jgi:hypothetical protein
MTMTAHDRQTLPRRLTRAVAAPFVALALVLLAAATLRAHDLFLRLERYVVPPNSEVRVYVLNGTFSKSEGAVTRDRLRVRALLDS